MSNNSEIQVAASFSQDTSSTPKVDPVPTEAPTTNAPTTDAPTTEAPTTEAPTTEAPSPSDASTSLGSPDWSSTRAIWLKLKYKSGASTASGDPQFERASSDLQQVAKFAAKTLSDCRAYLATHGKTSPHTVLTANLNNYYSDDEASEARQQIAELNQLTVEANESSIAAFERYNEGVIGPIEQWLAEYAVLQPQIKLHRDWHLAFDHYQSKVSSMQCKLDKLRAQDQEVKPNNEQRLLRNLAKLEAAKAGYDELNEKLTAAMQQAYTARFAAFAPVVTGFVNFHHERADAVAKRG